MAPLWGSSLASTWQSLTGYSPVPTSEPNGTNLTPDSSLNTLKVRPTVGQMLSSKRVRVAAGALLAVTLFWLAFHNYDQISNKIPSSWASGSPSASTGQKPDCPVPAQPPAQAPDNVDWSRFAYTQYVTNAEYLCNSVMIFETLHRLKSKADRAMMFPSNMLPDITAKEGKTDEARLLIKARDEYKVKLVPINIQRRNGGDSTWAESYTKLLAFNQTQYDRVLSLDSDATVLQTMDELFLIPPCPVAMPRAYWLFPKEKILSSQLMLVQPSAAEFSRVQKKTDAASRNDYDMEIVNQLYADQAMILPHRPYDLLTGEFRGDDHEKYLGTDLEKWDPVAVFNEAKFLHFSDWPVPKPWKGMTDQMRQDKQPKCVTKDGQEDCSARELWNGFYKDFVKRREQVCKTGRKTRAARR